MLAITRAAQAGDTDQALTLSLPLDSLWVLLHQHGGSLRILATAAELQGRVSSSAIRPPSGVEGADRQRLGDVLKTYELE